MRPRAIAALFAAGTALGVSLTLDAQAPDQPTFRTGTTLVEVSAIVTSGGHPVADLRRDEVTILDDGTPQPIVVFEAVDLGNGERPDQGRDFVLVFDDLHIDATRTQFAQDVALALIRALGPHDRLAITNTAGDDLAMDFSTDRQAAAAVVKRARGQAPPMLALARGTTPAAGLEDERVLRARQAMQVLRDVATSIRGDARERRAVVLVSEGHKMPGDENGLDDHPGPFLDYLDVLREAALSNVAVYAIDPRGLSEGSALSDASQRIGPSAALRASRAVRERFGSLGLLADNTGGILTVWTNDLAVHIPRLLQDSRRYYRLAYAQPEPPPGRKPPRTRRIEVKVDREGIEVRARQRYAPVSGS